MSNYIKVPGFNHYYVNELGEVFRHRQGKYGDIFKPLKYTRAIDGSQKLHFCEEGKLKTVLVHDIVYRAFKGDYRGNLVFLDGDKTNCNINNLITLDELVSYYNKYHK